MADGESRAEAGRPGADKELVKDALRDILNEIPGFRSLVQRLEDQATQRNTDSPPGVSGARADGGSRSSSHGGEQGYGGAGDAKSLWRGLQD